MLLIHALSQLRLSLDRELCALIEWFSLPRELPADFPALSALPYDKQTLAGAIASLVERDVLTEKTPEEELILVADRLGDTHGRDPGELLERFRRGRKEGAEPYWTVAKSQSLQDLSPDGARFDVLLLGDCELQMESDFLRGEAARRGINLRVAASFPSDIALCSEHVHDAVIVGALRTRNTIALAPSSADGPDAFAIWLDEARRLLEGLRERTKAPILIDNLPVPTVQPLGIADHGTDSHRNRYRRASLALERLAEEYTDVHVVDIAAALGAAGSERLLDDGLTSFSHFGSPGWMLQRPAIELTAVHGISPDMGSLADALRGNPYLREEIVAAAHIDVLVSVLGIGAKKCVIVDLDGVLWPGVLAETGAPFAWHPESSGLYSYFGLFVGIHEALKALKRRGIVLAAVSKNDETVVRDLWRYPDHYPLERLLVPDDFVTWRVNWNDKAENIRSIACELGFALGAFLFVDDHPVERERVNRMLPEVTVLGENILSLRRALLTDARLQPPRLTPESNRRTALVRAHLERAQSRAEAVDETEFVKSLAIECTIDRLEIGASLERVEQLFARTTQFTTAARKFSLGELSNILVSDGGRIFIMRVRDRFGDQGVVGAAVIADGSIIGFALSCRVIGVGVEHRFIGEILSDLSVDHDCVTGRIVETARNLPSRNIYRDNGFVAVGDGLWRRELHAVRRACA